MTDPAPSGSLQDLLASDRAQFLLRRVGPVLLVVVGLLVALALYDALSDETGNTGVSESYRIVEADESWLGYLPADGAVPGLSVAGLTSLTDDGPVARRVDFLLPGTSDDVVSLCFVGFDGDLAAACPDAVPLGEIERGVGLSFVGLVGPIGALDWLGVYSSPTPELDSLNYLRR